MSTNQVNCQNCEQPFEKGFQFCPHCGQKTNEELTLKVLFYNTICNYFSFDARFFKSFIPLMFRPGYLATKFVEGKRLLYLHPAQMYLFISVVFFFIISFSTRELIQEANNLNDKVIKIENFNPDENLNLSKDLDSVQLNNLKNILKNNQEQLGLKDEDVTITDSIINTKGVEFNGGDGLFGFKKAKIDSLVDAGADESIIYKEMGMSDDAGFIERRFYANLLNVVEGRGAGAILQVFFDSIPISMFFLLPFFALILKVFYFRKGRYAYHLVFSFYHFSYLFTVFSILFAINRFVVDIPDGIDWLVALSTYFYFLFALIKFYKQNWFISFIKSGIISFIFLLMVIPLALIFVLAFSFLAN
jgi:hypothetical protein